MHAGRVVAGAWMSVSCAAVVLFVVGYYMGTYDEAVPLFRDWIARSVTAGFGALGYFVNGRSSRLQRSTKNRFVIGVLWALLLLDVIVSGLPLVHIALGGHAPGDSLSASLIPLAFVQGIAATLFWSIRHEQPSALET